MTGGLLSSVSMMNVTEAVAVLPTLSIARTLTVYDPSLRPTNRLLRLAADHGPVTGTSIRYW